MDERAQVLARDGNMAIVQLAGRAFPGIYVQGDTFAELKRQLMDAAGRLQRAGGDDAALADLHEAVNEMAHVLRLYEAVLAECGIGRPYARDDAG